MLVKPKERREKKSNAGLLVYQYECKCKKVYIGETGRSLKTRESEHKRVIRNGDGNHSGISKHVLETGHTILWDEVQILAYETNWRKRKIKESFFHNQNELQPFIRHKARHSFEQCISCALTRAPLGYSAERAPLGGWHILPPLPNSRTNRRSEAGEAAIESPEREDSNAH